MSLARHLRALGLEPLLAEPLARHTFWRIGGPADALVSVPDERTLQAVLRLGEPVTLLGNGSNLLVSDRGIRGITVRLAGALRDATFAEDPDGPYVDAGAGMLDVVLLRRLADHGLAGLACLAGVPGTVGGAVCTNAGNALGEIAAALQHAEIVTGDGRDRILPADLAFAYRHASLPPGAAVAGARLRLRRDPEEAARIEAHLARRRATQPLDQPSCGSVFKNPPGDHAGRLIEAAGLKGAREGGATVSEKHANFIVNTGGATAAQVHALIARVRSTVHETSGVWLEPEVHPAGDWPAGSWPPGS